MLVPLGIPTQCVNVRNFKTNKSYLYGVALKYISFKPSKTALKSTYRINARLGGKNFIVPSPELQELNNHSIRTLVVGMCLIYLLPRRRDMNSSWRCWRRARWRQRRLSNCRGRSIFEKLACHTISCSTPHSSARHGTDSGYEGHCNRYSSWDMGAAGTQAASTNSVVQWVYSWLLQSCSQDYQGTGYPMSKSRP
jgi:hypothetical protein